jgi:hypothetical protein
MRQRKFLEKDSQLVNHISLTIYLYCVFIPITPLTEGAVMRRRAGGAGCGARAGVSHTPVREASGNRPLQLRGAAFDGWTGKDERGRKPAGSGG